MRCSTDDAPSHDPPRRRIRGARRRARLRPEPAGPDGPQAVLRRGQGGRARVRPRHRPQLHAVREGRHLRRRHRAADPPRSRRPPSTAHSTGRCRRRSSTRGSATFTLRGPSRQPGQLRHRGVEGHPAVGRAVAREAAPAPRALPRPRFHGSRPSPCTCITSSRASPRRRSGSACPRAIAGSSRSGASNSRSRRARRWASGRFSSIGAGLRPEGLTPRAADRQGPARRLRSSRDGLRSLARVRSNRRPPPFPPRTSTSMWSPVATRP